MGMWILQIFDQICGRGGGCGAGWMDGWPQKVMVVGLEG